MAIYFSGIPTEDARKIQRGGVDAYGQLPERYESRSDDLECRHCGRFIAPGEGVLLFAWRPFADQQPFAETGPILLHERECDPLTEVERIPDTVTAPETRLVRGYDADSHIIYGTGQVTATQDIHDYCESLLKNPDVSFIHIRSATNNCWQGRVERGA